MKSENYSAVAQIHNKPITEAMVIQGKSYVVQAGSSEYELAEFIIPEIKKAILIANRTDDVQIIANKLGINQDIIEFVKNHYFKNEHFMLNGDSFQIGRFERLYGDSEEWLLFVDKPISDISEIEVKRFKWLLAHEYIEGKLMEKGMSFRSLNNSDNHFIYDNGAHWQSVQMDMNNKMFYDGLNRLPQAIPPIPNNNLDNLDEIVDFLIDFNKL
ncbi:hypothetical protein [Pedobacter sp. MW01-1-1]|uniref:hypothetical protein n=1 Tax=Pedobacter sp. MW01-1-1 TaxID=3383027 RepID=UPI003FEED23E